MTSSEPVGVSVSALPVRLGQLLQLANLVESGAEAKRVIAEGLVSVDGVDETRRGRQLHGGETVALHGGAAVRIRSGPGGDDPDQPRSR